MILYSLNLEFYSIKIDSHSIVTDLTRFVEIKKTK